MIKYSLKININSISAKTWKTRTGFLAGFDQNTKTASFLFKVDSVIGLMTGARVLPSLGGKAICAQSGKGDR